MATKIFFDSEFTGLRQDTTLISIGFVSECGEQFYAEFTDFDRSQVDTWLEKNVISSLTTHNDDIPDCACVGDSDFVRGELLKWFSGFDSIELWSDCLSYDWVLLSELIADRSSGYPVLPDNFVYHSPFDILVLFKVLGLDYDVSREHFARVDGGDKHNALWDAHVIKACYERLVG